jgi:hypothetical protein
MTSVTIDSGHVFATIGETTLALDLYRAPQTDAPLVLYVRSGEKADACTHAILTGVLLLASPALRSPTCQPLVAPTRIVLGRTVLARPGLGVAARNACASRISAIQLPRVLPR